MSKQESIYWLLRNNEIRKGDFQKLFFNDIYKDELLKSSHSVCVQYLKNFILKQSHGFHFQRKQRDNCMCNCNCWRSWHKVERRRQQPCGTEVPKRDCRGQNPLSTTPLTRDHDTYHNVGILLFISRIRPMSVAAICSCEDWTRQFIRGESCLGWPSLKAWTKVALRK